MSVAVANKSKPFLHWIGSKRRIVNKLIEHLPQGHTIITMNHSLVEGFIFSS
ncbi:putative site-specific DNA adenine methylase [Orientia tsutsugamushi str. UT76]|nr:putative site-specific DNA adenine methylase [Orientia tsutsugamushi str. UT76]